MRVNQRFAAELKKVLQPEDIVWVHDYHLMPLAKELRNSGHHNRIGFFHHIPFPPPEILTALPNYEQLIPAMSYYDLIGFQTEIDGANFAGDLVKSAECRAVTPTHFRRRAGNYQDWSFSGWCRGSATQSARTACDLFGVCTERGGGLGVLRYDNWG